MACCRNEIAKLSEAQVLVHKVQAAEVQPKAGSANQRAKR